MNTISSFKLTVVDVGHTATSRPARVLLNFRHTYIRMGFCMSFHAINKNLLFVLIMCLLWLLPALVMLGPVA